MKIKRAAAAVLFLVMLVMSGCSGNATNGKQPDPAAITAAITSKVKYNGLINIQQGQLKRFYTIAGGVLDSESVYIASISSADEIAVFKAKDASAANALKDAITARIAQKTTDFEQYNPAEYDKVKKNVVEVRGNYVFFTVCADPAKARGIFDSFFTAK
ncbi:MAG: DUF4358 domain-containing protein [Clostridia bacterium]|nr:DUF4358 domain-containing protein [Clostridia bacterium]MDR3645671.1 DUF4358 domain-containing protein [Clostridia bacterium]